jgi:hypothetical protein
MRLSVIDYLLIYVSAITRVNMYSKLSKRHSLPIHGTQHPSFQLPFWGTGLRMLILIHAKKVTSIRVCSNYIHQSNIYRSVNADIWRHDVTWMTAMWKYWKECFWTYLQKRKSSSDFNGFLIPIRNFEPKFLLERYIFRSKFTELRLLKKRWLVEAKKALPLLERFQKAR